MACTFSVPFSGNPQATLSKVRSAVQSQGGLFEGNDQNGRFQVSAFGNHVAGTYTVMGQELHITITDKPFLLPCRTIENFLRNQLS